MIKDKDEIISSMAFLFTKFTFLYSFVLMQEFNNIYDFFLLISQVR